jgi:hypothetical protein
MAFQQIPGGGVYAPMMPYSANQALSSANAMVIDATGEMASFCGRFWHYSRTSKDVRNIGFNFGSVTKAGGSALTVSLQNISTATAPMQPDGTQDQTVAIANADAGFTSNAWYETGNLSADRTLTFGELVSVVIEYDGAGRLGADTVSFRCLPCAYSLPIHQSVCSHKTGGTYAVVSSIPNVVLKCTDGSYGTLDGSWVYSALGNHTYKQDTGTADEYANEFTFPFKCKVDGFWFSMGASAATADFDFVLYDGTSAMTGGTVSIDATQMGTVNRRPFEVSFSQEIELAANTIYRLAVKPTQTTASVVLDYFDVSSASHFAAMGLGTGCRQVTRLDLGSWGAATTTRLLFSGLRLSSLDDGAGGSAGIQLARQMTGGMSA